MQPIPGDPPSPPSMRPGRARAWLLPSQVAAANDRIRSRFGPLAPAEWTVSSASATPTDDGWVASAAVQHAGAASESTAEGSTLAEATDRAIAAALTRLEPVGMGLWWARASGDVVAASYGIAGRTLARWGDPDRKVVLDGLVAAVTDGVLQLRTATTGYVVVSAGDRRAAVEVAPGDESWEMVRRWGIAASGTTHDATLSEDCFALTSRMRSIITEPVIDLAWHRR